MSSSETLKIIKFNGEDDDSEKARNWMIKTKAVGAAKKWAKMLNTRPNVLVEDEVDKDAQAMAYLILNTTGKAFNLVKNMTSANEMWTTLEQRFDRTKAKDNTDLPDVEKEIVQCTYEKFDSDPEAMVNKISELLDEQAQMKGTTATDADKIYASIARLPSIAYQNFIVRAEDSIKGATFESPLSMELFKEELQGFHKKYIKPAVKKRRDNEATAMATMAQGKRPWRKFNGKCNYCGTVGHKKTECFKFLAANGDSGNNGNNKRRSGNSNGRRGNDNNSCLLYTSPSPRDLSTSRMPSSA